MADRDTIMGHRLTLAAVSASIRAIEEAREGLAIHHRDLTRQADWLREQIQGLTAEPQSSTDSPCSTCWLGPACHDTYPHCAGGAQ